jgi:predicted phage terminase large subunit-like protein
LPYEISDIELIEKYFIEKAKDDFYTFRRLIRPKDTIGWFYKSITQDLQDFYTEWQLGLKPQLVIEAPPQHGKSQALIDFIAWVGGRDQDNKIIFSSFSGNLSARANTTLQRIMDSTKYKKIFGQVIPNKLRTGKARHGSLIEFVDGIGYFRNTTVGGPITGESLDLGVIDDPIKGRASANSTTVRNTTWDWYTNDFKTRFSENAAFIMILTRWHTDDPAGRLQSDKDVKFIKYKAIAEVDDKQRKAGEPLFPEWKSLKFLNKIRKTLTVDHFESLYQQNPVIQGGNMFKTEWFKPVTRELINTLRFSKRFITADTALKTKEVNDYTVYFAWGIYENKLYLTDAYRGKIQSLERETIAKAFYKKNNLYPFDGMYIEDKASGTDLYQRMKSDGYMVRALEQNTDKVLRANEACPYAELHSIYYANDLDIIPDMLSELAAFPNGTNDDIVDNVMYGIQIAYQDGLSLADAYEKYLRNKNG